MGDRSTGWCDCRYPIPPPWAPFNAAEHLVHHLTWEETRRKVDGYPTSYSELAGFCRALQRLVDQYHLQAQRFRTEIGDLRELNRITCPEEGCSLPLWHAGDHGCCHPCHHPTGPGWR